MGASRAERVVLAVVTLASIALAVAGVVMFAGSTGLHQAAGLMLLSVAGLTLGVVGTRWQSREVERRWLEAKRTRRGRPTSPADARTRR